MQLTWPHSGQKKPFGANVCFLHNQVDGWINDKCTGRILGMTLALQSVRLRMADLKSLKNNWKESIESSRFFKKGKIFLWPKIRIFGLQRTSLLSQAWRDAGGSDA